MNHYEHKERRKVRKTIANRRIRLIDGTLAIQVDKDRYELSEKVRNWVLRLNYEQGIPKWMAVYRAAKKFGVTESYVKTAIIHWRKWCYGAGVRHRPLELFIEEDRKKNGKI